MLATMRATTALLFVIVFTHTLRGGDTRQSEQDLTHASGLAEDPGEDTTSGSISDGASSLSPGSIRGLYDKPFLSDLWRRSSFGGYTELEYHSFEDGILGIPEGFRMHRTNLFFFTDISDRVRFGSEIEFESEFEIDGPSREIETNVELAMVDWTVYEEFVIRGGALLVPLGRVNVNHDGPVRFLTERPLVSTFVIPTTLTEPGIGAHGTLAVTDNLDVGYEAYAVNGFNLLKSSGELATDVTEREQLLREGRTSIGGDVNGGIAGTGRVALSGADLFEIGGSWHVGSYDERSDNLLAIVAADCALAYEIDGWEFGFEGEVAYDDFERNAFAKAAGVPDRFWGYYAQLSVGFMPEPLAESLPMLFGAPGSKFVLGLRYDWIDLDGDRGESIEPGLNFLPSPDTVLKFSYRFTQNSFGLRDVPGREEFDDEGFVFSLTTYF